MLNKISSFGKKVVGVLAVGALAAQNALAAAVVTLPADAKTDLSDTITDNFPTVIGVVVIMISVSLLIGLIKRVGR